jgi:hypothetical protein
MSIAQNSVVANDGFVSLTFGVYVSPLSRSHESDVDPRTPVVLV